MVKLKATDGLTTVTAKKEISVKRQDIVARDGRFYKYANGIVKDTETGLEWFAGPDRDMNKNEAKSWVKSLSLNGGGWRMPTWNELRSLWKKDADSPKITHLLRITGWGIWSGATKERPFNFGPQYTFFGDTGGSDGVRAFAVRSSN